MTGTREERFGRLYEAHYHQVLAYLRRRLESDHAADAAADVFVTVWRRIEDVPAGKEALLWLYGVAHNVTRRHWRSDARHRRLQKRLESIRPNQPLAMDHTTALREEVAKVLEAATRLSDSDLELLRLSVWEDLPQRDIAVILGVTPNAVKQRLHRARRNLEREYEKQGTRPPQTHNPQQGGSR